MHSNLSPRARKNNRFLSRIQSTSSYSLHSLKRDVLSIPQDTEHRCSCMIWHPESRFRMMWDGLVTVLVVYQAVVVPYVVCFEVGLSEALVTLEVISVSAFLLDICKFQSVITCNTGFYHRGELVLNRPQILRHYAMLWLWLDLLGSLPLSWYHRDISTFAIISNKDSSSFDLSDFLRFSTLFRLFRLKRLKQFLVKIEDFVASANIANFLVFVRLLLVLLFYAHWMTCLFLYITNRDSNYLPVSWQCSLHRTDRCGNIEVYVTGLYWMFSSMTTVGYGEISLETTSDRICGTVMMVGSCGLFAYLLGDIGSLVAKNNAEYAVYRERVVLLNIFMSRNHIPSDLQYRSRRFLEYMWSQQHFTTLKEDEILSTLSEPLRNDISMEVNGAVILTCPVFCHFPEKLVGKLGISIHPERFAPGDVIFQEGQIGLKMYFIMKGKVEIMHAETETSFAILGKRRYFGEIGFLTGSQRCASAKCWEFAELFSLDKAKFNEIVSKYPSIFSATNELIAKVKGGDLTGLQIACYVCRDRGHLARHCSKAVVKGDGSEIRENWLSKRVVRTRYVSHDGASIAPNYHRVPKRPLHLQHRVNNVHGFPNSLFSVKTHNHRLSSLAEAYKVSLGHTDKGRTPTTRLSSPFLGEKRLSIVDAIIRESSPEELSPTHTNSEQMGGVFGKQQTPRDSLEDSSRFILSIRENTAGETTS